jgi:hypothetical protein
LSSFVDEVHADPQCGNKHAGCYNKGHRCHGTGVCQYDSTDFMEFRTRL